MILRRKLTIVLVMLCLGKAPVFAEPDGVPVVPPNPVSAPRTNALPSKITTTDGVTYNAPQLTRVEPDGLVVEFTPATGGTGLAKLKFAKLPAALQKQFGYNPGRAASYEQQEALATQALVQQLRQNDLANPTSLPLQNGQSSRPDPNSAVSVDSLEPVITYTLYSPGQKPHELGLGVADVENHYRCLAKFGVQVEPGAAGQPVHFHIDRVVISLDMTCRYIEPVKADDSIRRYDDGRRKIYEYFYRLAQQVAGTIGATVIGREFTASGANFEDAKKRALAEAEVEIMTQYMLRIEATVRSASQEYAQLTAHGTNSQDPDQAAQAACYKFYRDFLNSAPSTNMK